MKGSSPVSLPLRAAACQAEPVRPAAADEGTSVPLADRCQGDSGSPALRFLRTAIDERGWKHDAIASAIGVNPKYLSRMLSGEKPWTVRHLLALPDDVEALFVRKYAESFGLIVVERVSDDEARRQLAIGLFNVLAPKLPAKADRFAKASLPPSAAKVSGTR